METKAIEIAKRYMKGNDVSHDICHVRRVVKNAQRLLAHTPEWNHLDLEILTAITALHDCIDKKYVKPEDIDKQTLQLRSEIVNELGFTEETADFIIETINMISWSTEKQGGKAATSDDPYLALARDADRLEAIGAIGIARCFAYSAAVNRPLVSESAEVEKKAQAGSLDFHGDESAIIHFYDKLLKLQDRFKTEAGKKEAAKRHEFLQKFLQQISDEI